MSTDNRRMDEWVALEQFDLSTVQVEQVDEPVGPGGRQVMGGRGLIAVQVEQVDEPVGRGGQASHEGGDAMWLV